MIMTHTVIDSPLGEITLAAEDGMLTRLSFSDEKRRLRTTTLGARADAGFERVTQQLAEYFAGERTAFDVPLAPRGDGFQQRVWTLLRAIPYGETRSYGQLAAELGDPALARAVGAANGQNPIGIIVPCHRVIGSDGRLVGYAGGLERKQALLDLEESVAKGGRLFTPAMTENWN